MSLLGLIRSCGKVSQAGNIAILDSEIKSRKEFAISCAARSVAAISTTGFACVTTPATYGMALLGNAIRTLAPAQTSAIAPEIISSLPIALITNSKVIAFSVPTQLLFLVLGDKSKCLQHVALLCSIQLRFHRNQ